MRRACHVVQRVLLDLEHTPVSAVGQNFRFVCENPSGKISEAFDTRDLPALSDEELSVQSTTIGRCLRCGDQTLNMTMTFEGKAVVFDFNFHTPTMSATKALEALKVDPIVLKEKAIKILADVYDAKVHQEEQEYMAQHA